MEAEVSMTNPALSWAEGEKQQDLSSCSGLLVNGQRSRTIVLILIIVFFFFISNLFLRTTILKLGKNTA